MLSVTKQISKYNHYDGNDGIKYIVIHYIGGQSTVKNNADYFCGGDRQASANYFVGETSIYQVVEDFNGAWHCGNTRTEVNNKNSIGIEMECNNPKLFVTDKTIQNTCELVAYLMKKYNIPLANVRTHYEVTAYAKLCPNFANTSRWTDMKNKIQVEFNKLNTPAPKTPVSSEKRYAENKTFYFTTAVTVRTAPEENAKTSTIYKAGETVVYHHIILNKNGFNWIEYTRSNGTTGYLKIKDLSSGESYGSAK